MAAKKIIIDYPVTGDTLYCLIRRESDDFLLNDADGAFAVSPADPYVTLTENSVIKKRYELLENRTVWADGVYSIMSFKMVGGSPNLINDNLVGSGSMVVYSDIEVIQSNAQQINDVLSTDHGAGAWDTAATISILDSLVRFNMFEYKGNVDNVFSMVSGSFIGSINFYSVSMASFLAGATTPPLTNLICTLGSNGIMTSTSGLVTSGDIIFFTLVGFEALSDIVLNYYNDFLNTNTGFFIAKGLKTITSSIPYYPTVYGNLFGPVSTSYVTPISDGFINKSVSGMSNINWDRLSQPVVIDQSTLLASNVVRMNIIRDRTIDLQFDLHRIITGDTIYFAMKTDRKNDSYDVEPILCIIDNDLKGYVSLTVPEYVTQNLTLSKYYGELFRVTASGKFQTLVLFDIDLIPGIIATRDI